jgi:hypothetical protein
MHLDWWDLYLVSMYLLAGVIDIAFLRAWSRNVYTFCSEAGDPLLPWWMYVLCIASGPIGCMGTLWICRKSMEDRHGRFRETPAEFNDRILREL